MIFFAWTKIKQSFYQIETRQFRGAAQNTPYWTNWNIAAVWGNNEHLEKIS